MRQIYSSMGANLKNANAFNDVGVLASLEVRSLLHSVGWVQLLPSSSQTQKKTLFGTGCLP